MDEVEELIRNLRSPYLDRKWIEDAADRLETLAKALTVSPEKPGWRPMATAPRDGTRFIATDGETVQESYFDVQIGGFCATARQSYFDDNPSAWMPLPDPPVQQL